MPSPMTKIRSSHLLSTILTAMLLCAGCGATNPAPSPTAAQSTASSALATTAPRQAQVTPSPSASSEGSTATIPQPLVPAGLKTAPEAARVDLAMPTFSRPTEITNPLFPVSQQASVLMLGHVEGKPFRTEVTLLPFTKIVEWAGQRVETLVSQYCAYLDGRITEIAYDLYAQDDDWAVWYFGEDVFDFRDGAIVSTEGTWQAGRDGPAAMIMPGRPNVGDVYRTENAPGFVFEEVTVKATDQSFQGPLGPIAGGLTVSELHSDGTTEAKLFAPGYGEFRTSGGGDLEALALAVPTDAVGSNVPGALTTLSDRAMAALGAIRTGDWPEASREVSALERAWAQAQTGKVPPAVAAVIDRNLSALRGAIRGRRSSRAGTLSIDVARSAYDLQLLSRPATDVDIRRFDLWAAQTQLDVAAKDANGVNADVFALDYIRDRFVQTLDPMTAARLNTLMNDLQTAVEDDDFVVLRSAATGLRTLVAGLTS
jgi:hypothetical protein